ncbi:MAPEG family protein [Spongiibacter sp. KMU-158]|uniref:MAPEG family protein n=1 Tax=Spongiibacter pelagi TaxID=2760804 RepID=A0A927C036_9GAMM|nr:MAPEG family protein [Spongiibacter pelagi]MBD2857708.1 MAPEG family protein [Spongiibacter pelagi]
MTHAHEILLPVLVLVVWSHLILMWMAGTRLPAMSKLKMDPNEGQRTSELGAKMEKKIQWKADNYNHLMEHPTVFYATALSLALLGMGSGLNLTLAWAYVGLRIAHSLVQCTSNVVMLRFTLFLLSVICVLWMAINGVMALI